jgi:hypothetical protein
MWYAWKITTNRWLVRQVVKVVKMWLLVRQIVVRIVVKIKKLRQVVKLTDVAEKTHCDTTTRVVDFTQAQVARTSPNHWNKASACICMKL